MASYIKSLILVVAILIVAIMPKGSDSNPFKAKVQIINKLIAEQDLTVHCKDKDHDLGKQTIEYEKMFEFTVHVNVFLPVVLYFCSFQWYGLDKAVYFDIYKQTRDYKCNVCSWEINDSGPCKDGDCYPWNPSLLGGVLLNGTNISQFH